jgi:hypothetical protein
VSILLPEDITGSVCQREKQEDGERGEAGVRRESHFCCAIGGVEQTANFNGILFIPIWNTRKREIIKTDAVPANWKATLNEGGYNVVGASCSLEVLVKEPQNA